MSAAPAPAPDPSLIRVKTRPMLPPQDDLYAVLNESLPALRDGDVVVITSKIVAIHQGRCVPMSSVRDKEDLVEAEADAWIPKASSRYGITLAIKGATLIASAGIDASNSNDHYILWPSAPSEAAAEIGRYLKQRHGVRNLGVILSDSHCTPMRRGTTGITIGFYGFDALLDYRGTPDIFGRPLAVTLSNRADAMAAAAVGLMGEGSECIPVVIVRNWPDLVFSDAAGDAPGQPGFFIPPDEDIFAPLLQGFQQHGRSGGSGH
jgi:dihydrofolate synthase / folylpolyglutamate synthase